MEHVPRVPPAASAPQRRGLSHALSDAAVYRPGLLIAGVMLLVPPVLAVLCAGAMLAVTDRISLWLPLVLLLWVPLLVVAWRTLKSVRTSSSGIAVARPWSQWQEVSWALIDHARQAGPRIVIHASEGRSIDFYPRALQGGLRLKRELLVRLPMHVLDAPLRADAVLLLGTLVGQHGRSNTAEPAVLRPRRLWGVGLLTIIVVVCLSAYGAARALPVLAAIPMVVCASVVIVAGARGLYICAQTLVLTDSGIVVRGPLGQSAAELKWDDIQFIEQSPRERVLRLRSGRRLRCCGPALFPPRESAVFRSYLEEYCTRRGVPVIGRRWL